MPNDIQHYNRGPIEQFARNVNGVSHLQEVANCLQDIFRIRSETRVNVAYIEAERVVKLRQEEATYRLKLAYLLSRERLLKEMLESDAEARRKMMDNFSMVLSAILASRDVELIRLWNETLKIVAEKLPQFYSDNPKTDWSLGSPF